MAGSEIYKICERMEKAARREIQKFRSAHGIAAPSTMPSSRKRSAAKAQINTPVLQESRIEETDSNPNVVSTSMKMDLVHKVKKLPNEGLTKMVAYIQSVKSTSMTEMEHDRVQIRIDDFDRPTFDSVLEFVENYLLNDMPSKRQKTSAAIEAS